MFREQIGRMWTGHRFLWWLMHTSNIPLVVNHSLFSARTTTRQHVCRHQSGNGAAALQLRRAVLRLEMRCKIQHGRIMNRQNRATGSMGPNGSLMRCEVCLQHSPTTPEFAAQPFDEESLGYLNCSAIGFYGILDFANHEFTINDCRYLNSHDLQQQPNHQLTTPWVATADVHQLTTPWVATAIEWLRSTSRDKPLSMVGYSLWHRPKESVNVHIPSDHSSKSE